MAKKDSLAQFYEENLPAKPAPRELPPKHLFAQAASETAIRRWLIVGTATVVVVGMLLGLVNYVIYLTSPEDSPTAVAKPVTVPPANPEAKSQVASPVGPIVQFAPRPKVAPPPAVPAAPVNPGGPAIASAELPPVGPTNFPQSFILPAIEASEPVRIGTLPVKVDSIVELALIDAVGGDGKVAAKYLVQPNVLEGDMSRWSLRAPSKVPLSSTQSSDGRLVAARLSLDQGRLEFEWLPEAGETELAALDGCSLKVTLDGHSFSVKLRSASEPQP